MESSFFQNKNDSYIENSQLKNIFPNEKAKSSLKEKSFILKRNNNFLEEIQKQQNRSFHNRNLIKIESVKIEISSQKKIAKQKNVEPVNKIQNNTILNHPYVLLDRSYMNELKQQQKLNNQKVKNLQSQEKQITDQSEMSPNKQFLEI